MTATAQIQSKLPDIGTSIFAVMTRLANEHGAINLSQGFPDFACDPALIEAVARAMRDGHNQYAPMPGVLALRQAIAAKVQTLYGPTYDPVTEVQVTSGATAGLYATLTALVQPGDEVILFEPCYDSYVPVIRLSGGTPVFVSLRYPDYRVDWDVVKRKISPRTRAILVNTPHNPTGTTWSADDMRQLASLVDGTDILLIGDEVYEHIIFDDRQHISLMTLPGMRDRTVRIGSAGKSFSLTGWKVGYITAAPELMKAIAKTHQFMTFTTPPNLQWAVAEGLRGSVAWVEQSRLGFERSRNRLADGLARLGLKTLPGEATWFLSLDLTASGIAMSDETFCDWMVAEAGVAAIPISAFYADNPVTHLVRLCHAKQDSTLDEALARLERALPKLAR